MKSISFQSNIRNGLIKVPGKYKKLENSSVKVSVLSNPKKRKKVVLKDKIKKGFLTLQKMNVFDKINNPAKWQKKLRDEW